MSPSKSPIFIQLKQQSENNEINEKLSFIYTL